jgi:hypothetical protein
MQNGHNDYLDITLLDVHAVIHFTIAYNYTRGLQDQIK